MIPKRNAHCDGGQTGPEAIGQRDGKTLCDDVVYRPVAVDVKLGPKSNCADDVPDIDTQTFVCGTIQTIFRLQVAPARRRGTPRSLSNGEPGANSIRTKLTIRSGPAGSGSRWQCGGSGSSVIGGRHPVMLSSRVARGFVRTRCGRRVVALTFGRSFPGSTRGPLTVRNDRYVGADSWTIPGACPGMTGCFLRRWDGDGPGSFPGRVLIWQAVTCGSIGNHAIHILDVPVVFHVFAREALQFRVRIQQERVGVVVDRDDRRLVGDKIALDLTCSSPAGRRTSWTSAISAVDRPRWRTCRHWSRGSRSSGPGRSTPRYSHRTRPTGRGRTRLRGAVPDRSPIRMFARSVSTPSFCFHIWLTMVAIWRWSSAVL